MNFIAFPSGVQFAALNHMTQHRRAAHARWVRVPMRVIVARDGDAGDDGPRPTSTQMTRTPVAASSFVYFK
jgi:hypothetical protein